MEQLLSTKLFIPPLRRELVVRSRLTEQLNSGLHHKLTLVSAPAGFGKTTLLTEWINTQHLDVIAGRTAWISLDEGDNDPVRFLTYVTAALSQVDGLDAQTGKEALSMLQSPQPPPLEAILTSLINDLTAITDKTLLIFDDFHLIEASAVNDVLAFLLEHLPPQMHLVISTREDPQIPLSRLRARDQLTELRASDLRFTSSEAAEFLNTAMGLNLSTHDIVALEKRTEGWIAGLHLAAISMQGHKDPSHLIESFTGSHRLVLDYLIEEVLNQQPERVKTFLVQTSILGQMCGDLCDAITGETNSQQTLEDLDHANLFIVPLDEERKWYRYHHLFADLLRQSLHQSQPDKIMELNQSASKWYEQHDDLAEAIHHALVLDDFNTAARLIDKGAHRALERSELRFILNWVEKLPDNALESSPTLLMAHNWALILTGQIAEVSANLDQIEHLIQDMQQNSVASKQTMMGLLAALKAVLLLWQRDFDLGSEFANQARTLLPENSWCRGYCAIVEGARYFAVGDLNATREAYRESLAVGQAANHTMLEISAACNLAYILELEGKLQQAVKRYENILSQVVLDGKSLPVAGYAHVDFAKTLYELNELEAASNHVQKGIKLCQQLADGRAKMIGHCFMVRVQLAQGDYTGARDSVENAKRANPSPGTSFDLRGGEYPQIRLWTKEHNLSELEAWIKSEDTSIEAISNFKEKLVRTMHARAMITVGTAQSDTSYLNNAVEILAELIVLTENTGWQSKLIECLVLTAMAYNAAQKVEEARDVLERALILAEPRGFIRVFVDEGPQMAQLLYEALDHDIMPDYVRRLLAAFPDQQIEQTATEKLQSDTFEWVEPLSERELEVLNLIAEGLTNPEVATRLFLSPHTIKVHARNIYEKLGVSNRTQAVAKGRALGILSDD